MCDFKKLIEPFAINEYEWRVQSCGISKDNRPWVQALVYVTNRAIMDRLDEVCGPQNWRNEFAVGPGGGVVCGISIWVADRSQWVTKWDGAENTDIEEVKGGLSNAMKRAAVQWGIGRYLYKLDEVFCRQVSTVSQPGWLTCKTKDGNKIWWLPNDLPSWAVRGSGKAKVSSNDEPEPVQEQPQAKPEAKQSEPAQTAKHAAPAKSEPAKNAKSLFGSLNSPDPSAEQQAVLSAVHDALIDAGHADINPLALRDAIYSNKGQYPTDMSKVKVITQWIVNKIGVEWITLNDNHAA